MNSRNNERDDMAADFEHDKRKEARIEKRRENETIPVPFPDVCDMLGLKKEGRR